MNAAAVVAKAYWRLFDMVLRKVAATTAYLLIHRTSALTPRFFKLSEGALIGGNGIFPRQGPQRSRPMSAEGYASATDGESRVFALDFDGVICNSVGESSQSGFKALKNVFPDVVAKLHAQLGSAGQDSAPAWFVEKMRELRPVVETGYENILLARLLVEEKLGMPPVPSDNLLHKWGPEARDDAMRRFGVDREYLVEAFGAARDDWMGDDFDGWLAANSFYEGVNEAVSVCEGEVYVVTTKQERFASALLKHGGLEIPRERIYGLGSGPKADVLAELQTKHSGSTIHFFEDRVETLEGVCTDSRLQDVRLYLCDWGFNTEAHRARGKENARIRLIGTGDVMDIIGSTKTNPFDVATK